MRWGVNSGHSGFSNHLASSVLLYLVFRGRARVRVRARVRARVRVRVRAHLSLTLALPLSLTEGTRRRAGTIACPRRGRGASSGLG